MSATIGNIEDLVSYLSKVQNKTIHYVEYTQRFINQQKMIYTNNQLQKIHPLACITLADLNEEFLQQNLQFNPYDSAVLWETIERVFDETGPYSDEFEDSLDDCSPDNYFDDIIKY